MNLQLLLFALILPSLAVAEEFHNPFEIPLTSREYDSCGSAPMFKDKHSNFSLGRQDEGGPSFIEPPRKDRTKEIKRLEREIDKLQEILERSRGEYRI